MPGRLFSRGSACLKSNAVGHAVVSIGDLPPVLVTPPARFSTFAAAHHEPIFYGASEDDGALITVHCKVLSGRVSTFTHTIFGKKVRNVDAAAGLSVFFTCTDLKVWFLDLSEPSVLHQVGCVAPDKRCVISFASPTVAVAVVQHATRTLDIAVLATTPHSRLTWGTANASTLLTAPDWAKCSYSTILLGTITVFAGGRYVTATQLTARLAGPPQLRTRVLCSSRSAPVKELAVSDAEPALLCLLETGIVVQLEPGKKKQIKEGRWRSLTDCGSCCR